jgi:hypothetical protein
MGARMTGMIRHLSIVSRLMTLVIVQITATRRRTRSATSAGNCLRRPSTWRCSIVTSRPSTAPASWRPRRPLLADCVEKVLLGDERNFLGPLMRFAHGGVRDHIVSHKSSHGPSYRRQGALQRSRRLRNNFCEIFGAVRFSTFSTQSARSGHWKNADVS